MESQLLRALNFAVTVVTPFQFLGYLCDAAIPLPPSSASSSSSASAASSSSSSSSSSCSSSGHAGGSAEGESQMQTQQREQQLLLPALQLRSLARYIAELNTIEPVYFRYAPSHFAAACVLVALHALRQRTTTREGDDAVGCWSPALQQLRYAHALGRERERERRKREQTVIDRDRDRQTERERDTHTSVMYCLIVCFFSCLSLSTTSSVIDRPILELSSDLPTLSPLLLSLLSSPLRSAATRPPTSRRARPRCTASTAPTRPKSSRPSLKSSPPTSGTASRCCQCPMPSLASERYVNICGFSEGKIKSHCEITPPSYL
jgi:hypothetical protein